MLRCVYFLYERVWESMGVYEKVWESGQSRHRRLPLPPPLPAYAEYGGRKNPLLTVIFRYAAINRIAHLPRRSVMKTNHMRRNSLRLPLIFCREYICFSFPA